MICLEGDDHEAFVKIRESTDKSYSKIDGQQIIPQPVAVEILNTIPRQLHPYPSLGVSLLWRRGLAYLGMPEGRKLFTCPRDVQGCFTYGS